MSSSGNNHILVIPFPHPGHIFPAIELCRRLAGRNHPVTLFLPSTSSSADFSLQPLVTTVQFFVPHPTRIPPHHLEETIPPLLAQLCAAHLPPPLCAVVDEMMSWLLDACAQHNIPSVAFFTSSACSAAIEHATRGDQRHLVAAPEGEGGGDAGAKLKLNLPGIPDDLVITPSDLNHSPPHRHHKAGGGPRRPRGLAGSAGAGVVAMLLNTCDELERLSLEYIADAAGKPVWGVGPLLPDSFWAGSTVSDGGVRSHRDSSVGEGEVLAWLHSHRRASVVYVSFGSLVGPTDEELLELAAGLLDSGRPFIWVVQGDAIRPGGGDEPEPAEEVARRAGKRGLVIRGWAPQLMILGHPSTGAFVCHCGWNSTVEALGCGVPVLAWPIRGDQHLNAKLVTTRLRTGFNARGEGSAAASVTRADVTRGIERVMGDDEVRRRAAEVRNSFFTDGDGYGGFPRSSSASLDAFLSFVRHR